MSNNINVLFVSHEPELHGSQKALLELIKDLKNRYKIKPIVLVPYEGDFTKELKKMGVTFISAKYYWWMNDKTIIGKIKGKIKCIISIKNIISIIRVIKKYDIDIIHTNTSVLNIGYFISKKLNKPHIWHIREDARGAFNLSYNVKDKKAKKYFESADKIIYVSNFVKKQYLDLVKNDKSKVIYDGTRISRNYIKNFKLDKENILEVCIVGLVTDNKNQMEAIEALNLLLKRNKYNIRLNIIGDQEKNYMSTIIEYINENNLTNYIKIWGRKENIPSILEDMDLAIMPSKNEAFGLVTIEYMSKYIPVIGSNIGATKELIKDGENGFLYDLGDLYDLSNKIEYFIKNRKALEVMGTNAFNFVKLDFDNSINTDKIYKTYEEFI